MLEEHASQRIRIDGRATANIFPEVSEISREGLVNF